MPETTEKGNSRRRQIVRITVAGVMTALIFVATQIRIPTPAGFANLGDVVIIVCGFIMGPLAVIPAVIASAMADVVTGYPMFVPATAVIKGIMGFAVGFYYKKAIAHFTNKTGLAVRDYIHKWRFVIRDVAVFIGTELIMVSGYLCYEALPFMLGWQTALAELPYNLVQGLIGVMGALIVTRIPGIYRLRLK